MTTGPDEEELAEEQAPTEAADPEEYEADERETAVSDETGTVYDVEGEPETTPLDLDTTDPDTDE